MKTITAFTTFCQKVSTEVVNQSILNCWETRHIVQFIHCFRIRWLLNNLSQQSDCQKKHCVKMCVNDCLKHWHQETFLTHTNDIKKTLFYNQISNNEQLNSWRTSFKADWRKWRIERKNQSTWKDCATKSEKWCSRHQRDVEFNQRIQWKASRFFEHNQTATSTKRLNRQNHWENQENFTYCLIENGRIRIQRQKNMQILIADWKLQKMSVWNIVQTWRRPATPWAYRRS